jgi:hypothetical protein
MDPTQRPTNNASTNTTTSPTPTLSPTLPFVFVENITLNGVLELQFRNVTNVELNTSEIMILQTITEDWFMNYYNIETFNMKIELTVMDAATMINESFDNDDDDNTNSTMDIDDDAYLTNTTIMDDNDNGYINTNVTDIATNTTTTINETVFVGNQRRRQLQIMVEDDNNNAATTNPTAAPPSNNFNKSTMGTTTVLILIESMITTITIVSQNITTSTISTSPFSFIYINVIQYQQQLTFRYYIVETFGDSSDDNVVDNFNDRSDENSRMDINTTLTTFEGNATTINQIDIDETMIAQALAVEPFLALESAIKYRSVVQMNIAPFATVGDIDPPQFFVNDDDSIIPTTAPNDSEWLYDRNWIGVIIIGIIVILCSVYGIVRLST